MASNPSTMTPPRCTHRAHYGPKTSQVGIRACKRDYPAKSPSHAAAQWHQDLAKLAYRCGGSAGLIPEGTPASRFTHRPRSRRTPERRLSLPAISVTVNTAFTPVAAHRAWRALRKRAMMRRFAITVGAGRVLTLWRTSPGRKSTPFIG